MRLRSEYLVAYDVERNKARTRLHKALLAYGMRAVQKSVFWGYLSQAELSGVRALLKDTLDKEDKAFITQSSLGKWQHQNRFGYCKDDFTDWDEHTSI